MENASKALIIAGAILLAILIIGLGIFIYNQASNTVSDTGMDQVAIRQFNGQFEQYLDRDLSSLEVKSLIDTAKAPQFGTGNITLEGIINKQNIIDGHTYKTDVEYSNNKISKITIIDSNSQNNFGADVIAFNSRFAEVVPVIFPQGNNRTITLNHRLNIEQMQRIYEIWELANDDRPVTLSYDSQDLSKTCTGCEIINITFDEEGYISAFTGRFLYAGED